MRRRFLAWTSAGIVAAAVAATSLVSPWAVGGCQTHQCDEVWQSMGTIASPAGGGVGSASISADGTEIVWQSSPFYGYRQWLLYEGMHHLEFQFPPTLPPPFACQPWPAPDGSRIGVDPITVWVTQYDPDLRQCLDGNTSASGQDAQIGQLRVGDGSGDPGGFWLTNGSCQPYCVWIEARFPLPTTPCPSGTDASTDDAP